MILGLTVLALATGTSIDKVRSDYSITCVKRPLKIDKTKLLVKAKVLQDAPLGPALSDNWSWK